ADMLIAVTDSDEINMLACSVAFTLYRTPTKISRVRSADYLAKHKALFESGAIPVDVIIGPEQLVTKNIEQLIANPGSLQVLDFADGRIRLVAVKAVAGGPIVGRELQEIREHMPRVDTRVAAIFRRGGDPIIPEGATVVEPDDEVFFIAAKRDITAVMSELRGLEAPYKRIIVAGGGHIGERLAKVTAKGHHVKIIEYDASRAMALADALDGAVVIQGDATDGDLLMNENIESTDVFCALTNDDEANIMSSMLAKRLGARKVMTLISKPAYVDLVQGGVIDVAISPQQATISELLAYVRRGDVARVHSLRRGAAEAMEAIAHGDSHSSKVVGRRLDEIRLPPGASIGALVLAPGLALVSSAGLATGAGMAMVAHLGVLTVGVAYLLYGIGLRHLKPATAVSLTVIDSPPPDSFSADSASPPTSPDSSSPPTDAVSLSEPSSPSAAVPCSPPPSTRPSPACHRPRVGGPPPRRW
ncbi:MAG: Trk system potassium transporter TrkA, partial [Actinobacteria bacterium]|nr:Trk system potassium transporter TrkA [Actinomycetota bacterium]